MLAVRIGQGHRQRFGAMAGHEADQFARIQVMAKVVGGDLDQTEARQATGDTGFGAVTVTRPRIGGARRTLPSIGISNVKKLAEKFDLSVLNLQCNSRDMKRWSNNGSRSVPPQTLLRD